MFAPTICAANAELLRQPSTQESVRKAALQVQEKADKGVCKPQADSEVRANSAGRVEQVFPRIVFSGMGKDYRANDVRPLRFVRQTPNYYINHPHKRHPEKQHCRYRKRQTKAFASQRRTARVTSDSAGRVFGVISRIIYPPALSGIPLFKGD